MWAKGLLLLLIFSGLLCSACFRRFRMTEKDLEQFYSSKNWRPTYHKLPRAKGSLHWVQSGPDSLPRLLFIHGAPGAWYGYIRLMANPEIRSHFQVLSVDRPGYNYSKGSQIHNIEQQAEEIARLLDSDTLRPVYLVGRSFGAPVAAALAAIRPKLVKGLVLVAPAANPELEKFWWFSPILHYSPVRLFFPQAIRRASNEKYSHPKALKEMENLWGKVRCQTQILQGGKDEIVLPQNACYVDSMLVGAPHLLRMLPENGHLITSENPDLVVQLLLDLKSGRL